MIEWMTNPNSWIELVILSGLEIILGLDNIIFISILVGRLPEKSRETARFIGLSLAMGTRLLLLLSISWLVHLTEPLFFFFSMPVSGQDLILLGGGGFLLYKSFFEIVGMFSESNAHDESIPKKQAVFWKVLLQISMIDIVFSLDSVITAIGIAEEIPVMMLAIVLSVIVMMFSSKAINEFIEKNQTIKVLALSFLFLLGVVLVVDGLGMHVPKGYLYFSMGFSLCVEIINIRLIAYLDKKSKSLPK